MYIVYVVVVVIAVVAVELVYGISHVGIRWLTVCQSSINLCVDVVRCVSSWLIVWSGSLVRLLACLLRSFGWWLACSCMWWYYLRVVEFNESRKVSRFSLLKSFATFGSLFHKTIVKIKQKEKQES